MLSPPTSWSLVSMVTSSPRAQSSSCVQSGRTGAADWLFGLYVERKPRPIRKSAPEPRVCWMMETSPVSQPLGPPSCPPNEFQFSDSPSMEEIRQRQARFTAERDWNKFHQPRNLLLALVGEVGEVAELFQWQGEVAEGLPGWSPSQRESLSHELSDVLIYLLELAEKCHVDLPRAVLAKMALNAEKYPAARVQGSAKKYTEYSAAEIRAASSPGQ